MICLPLLLLLFVFLFEKEFRYLEAITIIICMSLYVTIFYFGYKQITSPQGLIFGYFIAFFERILIERLPMIHHKTIFNLGTNIARLSIMGLMIWPILTLNLTLMVFSFLLDYQKERKERELFKSFYDSRESLFKFKEMFKSQIPESMLILKTNLQETIFNNDAFTKEFPNSSKLPLREVLRRFRMEREDYKRLTARLSEQGIFLETEETRRNAEPASMESNDNNRSQGWDSRSSINLYSLLLGLHKADFAFNETWFDFAFIHPNTNGEEGDKILKIKVYPFVWDGQKTLAMFIYDLTQQYMLMNLKLANENKDKVVATVSHELRTPLNGILGMVQIMEREVTETRILKYLKTCKSSARLLLSLVNSILDMAQIKNNKIKMNPENHSLKSIMEDIIPLFDFQCVQKQIYLKLEMDENLPLKITTDRNRLTQILINLIGNALKFTFNGGITISVRQDEMDDAIKFSVIDTGVGIKEQDKEKLFQLYGKLEGTAKMNSQGIGLGLNISNTLAKYLNGDIESQGITIESTYEVGSTFSFNIKQDLYEAQEKLLRRQNQINFKAMSVYADSQKLIIQEETPEAENQGIETLLEVFDENDGNIMLSEEFEESLPSKLHSRNIHNISPLNISQLRSELPSPGLSLRSYQGRYLNNQSYNFDQCMSPTGTNLLGNGFASTATGKTILNFPGIFPRVLVVDDSAFNLMIAKELIEAQGYSIDTALNGKLAIDQIISRQEMNRPYDLVLMDCEMPVMNGFDATRALVKKMKKGMIECINIVALTANNAEIVREKCLKVGMADCITKPLMEADLRKTLAIYVRTNSDEAPRSAYTKRKSRFFFNV